jgi:hypothetical protein
LNHDVFNSGTALHDFDKGVKPAVIRTDGSQKKTEADYKQLFRYDFQPVENPESMYSFKACNLEHGGLCEAEYLVGPADVLSFNLAQRCNEWKHQFPVLLEFGVGAAWRGFVVLARMVSSGQLLGMFHKCLFLPRGPERQARVHPCFIPGLFYKDVAGCGN